MSSNHLLRATACAFLIVATTALVLGMMPARAERVESPLELLYKPGNLLVAGPLIEINPSGRLVFARKEVLGGKPQPPDKIDVRAPMSALQTAKLGERYIFGYSLVRPDPRNPTRTIADPDGAILLTSIGLEPALFRDTPDVRAILKVARSERGRESQRLFDLLMQALAGPDPQLQNLAAGEIAQELEMGERLREGGRNVVEKVARNLHTPAGVRATLLLAAATRPADLGDWWQAASTDVVTSTPVDGYAAGTSDPTGLVLLALEVLNQHAVTVPPDALKRWVWSASPALVERACLMLRREFPAGERTVIQQALADPKLPGQTRKFLNDHLRRLDRLDAKSNARKDGTG